jgi:DNA-binding CsgD family transcriptional regulator
LELIFFMPGKKPTYKELEQKIKKLELEIAKENSKEIRQFKNSRLMNLLDIIPDGVYIVNQKGDIKYVNPVIKKEFGHIDNCKCHEYFHGRTKACTNCMNARVFAGNSIQWQWHFRKTNSHYDMFETVIRDSDDSKLKLVILHDITKLIHIEKALRKSESSLMDRTRELEDMNAALKVLLGTRNAEAQKIEEKIFSNYKQIILPIVERLKANETKRGRKVFIELLESELKNIISPFSKKLSDPMMNLTPKEIEIASLIKFGKTNKEIADFLNNSIHTISHHRENIREKIGLKNKKRSNLRTFLSAL